jgi:hypothetical protein
MLLSQFIEELQAVYKQSGDVEVSLYNSTNKHLEEATIELVTNHSEPSKYVKYDLEKGCRCLSCWKTVEASVPFLLIT